MCEKDMLWLIELAFAALGEDQQAQADDGLRKFRQRMTEQTDRGTHEMIATLMKVKHALLHKCKGTENEPTRLILLPDRLWSPESSHV